jgi:hypothetical protein
MKFLYAVKTFLAYLMSGALPLMKTAFLFPMHFNLTFLMLQSDLVSFDQRIVKLSSK